MKVYRLCRKSEIESIIQSQNFSGVGKKFEVNDNKNNHKYSPHQKYLHFFKSTGSLLYLNTLKGRFIAVYDFPPEFLERRKGVGKYMDFVSFSNLRTVEEYAISTRQIKIKNLVEVYQIVRDIDYKEIWRGESFLKYVKKCSLRSFDLQQQK